MIENKVWQQNQVFFISTTQKLSVNSVDLQAPTLEGPSWANQGHGPTSCITPRQLTVYNHTINMKAFMTLPFPPMMSLLVLFLRSLLEKISQQKIKISTETNEVLSTGYIYTNHTNLIIMIGSAKGNKK